jgi:hypothetical protein
VPHRSDNDESHSLLKLTLPISWRSSVQVRNSVDCPGFAKETKHHEPDQPPPYCGPPHRRAVLPGLRASPISIRCRRPAAWSRSAIRSSKAEPAAMPAMSRSARPPGHRASASARSRTHLCRSRKSRCIGMKLPEHAFGDGSMPENGVTYL